MIEVHDLYKSFNNLEVIKGVNLKVERGEVVSIIGASGSGNMFNRQNDGASVFVFLDNRICQLHHLSKLSAVLAEHSNTSD